MLLVPNTVREDDAVRKTALTHTLRASVLASLLTLVPMVANSAGLGKITVLSGLGQPLRAEVELSASSEELSALTARLASHDAFKQAGIEFTPALSGVRFAIDKRGTGQPVIRLSTDRPVNEPFLDLLIEINWSAGRLVREYTFLLDPPAEVLMRKPAEAAAARRDQAAVAQPVPAPKQPEARDSAPLDARATAKKSDEQTAERKLTGESGMREVKRGEYLRKIAAETKPEGVSLDQMLVALFRGNKEAFIGNNMHRMKAGKILSIPEREAVAAVSEGEARKIISVQTADFNAYRKRLADAAAGAETPKEALAQQETKGKITAKVEEKTPALAETKDQLKISKAEVARDSRAAQGKIAALEEDLTARDKALKEAQSRQADLEQNVKKLQEILALKDKNLAELQKQAAAKPVVAESKKSEPPAPAPAPVAAPIAAVEPARPSAVEKPADKVVEPAKPAETAAAKPAEGEKPAESARPEEMKPAEPARPAEAPKPPVPTPAAKPAEPPTPEPSFLEELTENPAILGGGVLVLGLLGFVAYRQRQKRKQAGEGTPTTTVNLAANSVFGTTGGQSVDTSASSMATDFSQASISAIDSDEGVDPVAEADVYMAYGRDAQAEEILLDALKSDPTRTAIHVKLLEIYAARKNSKQFETLASDLYAQTGGVGADWEKVAVMGQKLDATNPLYGGGAAAASAESQSVSTDTTVAMPAASKVRDTWTMPGELSQIAEAVENGTATVILDREAAGAADSAAAVPSALDFDLDLGAPAVPAPPSVPAAKSQPAAMQQAGAGLDFDLGPDIKRAVVAKEFRPDETTMVMDVTKSAKPSDLDIDLKLGEFGSPGKPAEEPLHFDLDLGQAAAGLQAPVVDLEKTFAGGNVLDFDFNLGSVPAAAASPQESSVDLSSISLDLDDGVAAAGDDSSTKLELRANSSRKLSRKALPSSRRRRAACSPN
jgi:pilus assembly protein FimV